MSLSQEKIPNSIEADTSHHQESSKTVRLNGEKDKNILANDSLIQKDRRIISLENTIKKLELKNKECLMYEKAVLEYQEKVVSMEQYLFKSNEQLRTKKQSLDEEMKTNKQLKKKLHQLEKSKGNTTQENEIILATNELNELKQKNKRLKQLIINYQNQIKTYQEKYETLSIQNQNLHNIITHKQLQTIKNEPQHSKQIDLQSKQQIQRLALKLKNREDEVNFYHSKCQKLQIKLQQYQHSASQWSTQEKNQQYRQIIDQYEEHLLAMTNKMSSFNEIETKMRKIDQERQQYKETIIILSEQSKHKTHYIEILEGRLKEKDKKVGTSEQFQQLQKKIITQQMEIQKLTRIIKEKHKEINQLKDSYLSLSEETHKVKKLQNGLNKLQNTLEGVQKQLSTERQKLYTEQQNVFKLKKLLKSKEIVQSEHKSEINELNRIISQKLQKIQFLKLEIQHLTKENKEKLILSEKYAKLQNQFTILEGLYDKQLQNSNELASRAMVAALELQRKSSEQAAIEEKVQKEIRTLSQKITFHSQQSKHISNLVINFSKTLSQIIEKVKILTNFMNMYNLKMKEMDKKLEGIQLYLRKVEEDQDRNHEQIGSSIETWLRLQDDRLSELEKMDSDLFLQEKTLDSVQ